MFLSCCINNLFTVLAILSKKSSMIGKMKTLQISSLLMIISAAKKGFIKIWSCFRASQLKVHGKVSKVRAEKLPE